MNAQLALHNAVDPRTFLMPFGFRSRDLSAEGFEHSMYLGLIALALGLVALWKAWGGAGPGRRGAVIWLGAAAVSAVFALGPYLYWGDGWLALGDQRLRLPWWAVHQLAPGLAITHPLRLAVPLLAIVSGFAALGASALAEQRPRLGWALAGAVLLDGLVISGAPWPVATAPAAVPAVYAQTASASDTLAILDLPTDAGETMATSRYLWWQTGHARPIPYGPDARASTSALINDPAFRVLAALSNRRVDEHGRLGFARPGGGRQDAAHFADLDFGWIVLHTDLDPEAAAAIEAQLTGELGPGEAVGSDLIWTLTSAGSTP